MSAFLMVLVLVFLILGVLVAVHARKGKGATVVGEAVYEACRELFSPAERSFFGVLEQAVAGEFKVVGKVRLGDLIRPAKGLSPSRRTSLRNRAQQKHVDFVLCCPDSLAVVAVVELDDASHARKDRIARDGFVDNALTSAGVPILRFPARKGYVVAEVRERLAASLGTKCTENVVPNAVVSVQVEQSPEPPAAAVEVVAETAAVIPVVPCEEGAPPAAEKSQEPVCPACNVPMVKRQAKKGQNAGKWFWACTGYPKCRKVLAIR